MKSILKTLTIAGLVLLTMQGIGHPDEMEDEKIGDLTEALLLPSSSPVYTFIFIKGGIKEDANLETLQAIGGFRDWAERMEEIPLQQYSQFPAEPGSNPYAVDMIVTNLTNKELHWKNCRALMRSVQQMGQLAALQLVTSMFWMHVDQGILPEDKKKKNYNDMTTTQGMFVAYHQLSGSIKCVEENMSY